MSKDLLSTPSSFEIYWREPGGFVFDILQFNPFCGSIPGTTSSTNTQRGALRRLRGGAHICNVWIDAKRQAVVAEGHAGGQAGVFFRVE